MSARPEATAVYGLLAEFEHPEELLVAAREARQAGYQRLDAFTPFPVEELAEELGSGRDWLPWIVLAGGVLGAALAYGMQYYSSVIGYPMNVGGRPLNSWPVFIVIVFELTVLFAALSAVLGMLALNGLPQPYHPVFNVPRFQLATRDRFFLLIEAADPRFDHRRTRRFLEGLGAREVSDVLP